MADVYIYSSLPLREARGGLEDDLEEFLGTTGEVTGGGGGGERGWNIDLEISDAALPKQIEEIKDFLQEWGVPPDTYFEVLSEQNSEKKTRYDVFATQEVVKWINTTLVYLAERLDASPSEWQSVRNTIEDKLTLLEVRPKITA